ncbi:MAG: hydantoinase/oxoprolinase family protein, partial [Pseudomonadota bacterium]
IVPAVNVWAIGAGGGSILWVDPQGLLKVGPQSAGADPGPVAYGRGGTEPTVTDCYLVLGFIDPDRFLGGRMPLQKAAARKALAALGARIGFMGDDAAERTAAAALRIATAKMASEIGKGMASRGLDPATFTLVPYGGAGPTHAALLAEAARIGSILIPPAPGTFCAFGTATGALRRDFARSRRVSLGSDDGAATTLLATLSALEEDARAWLAEEAATGKAVRLERFADMQYPRTATELTVAIPEPLTKGASAAALAELFHVEHTHRYGFRDAQSPVDVTTVRLVATLNGSPAGHHRAIEASAGEARKRTLIWEGRSHEADVHGAGVLADGGAIKGPAVLEMEDSTVIVPPGWTARKDKAGALAMERKAHSLQEVAA